MDIILYVLIGFSLSCCDGYIADLAEKFFVKSAQNYSMVGVIFMQAFIFGVTHMNIIQSIYCFMSGVFYMILVLWIDNLYPAVICHMAGNLYGVVVLPFLHKYGVDLKMPLAVLTIPLLIIAYKKKYDALDKNNPYWN